MKLVLQMNQNDGLLTYLSTINPQKSPSINRCNWNGSSSAFGNNEGFVGKLVAPQKTLMFWRENRNGTKRAFQNMEHPV
jgi:hypothetical protein